MLPQEKFVELNFEPSREEREDYNRWKSFARFDLRQVALVEIALPGQSFLGKVTRLS